MKTKIKKRETRFLKDYWLLEYADVSNGYTPMVGIRKYGDLNHSEFLLDKKIDIHTMIRAFVYSQEHIIFIPKKRREYILQRRDYEI